MSCRLNSGWMKVACYTLKTFFLFFNLSVWYSELSYKIISSDQVIEGLDRAVKTMKKGEVAHVIIQPEYAFGQSDSTQELAVIPGNSAVYYEVEMVSFVKVCEIMEFLYVTT